MAKHFLSSHSISKDVAYTYISSNPFQPYELFGLPFSNCITVRLRIVPVDTVPRFEFKRPAQAWGTKLMFPGDDTMDLR